MIGSAILLRESVRHNRSYPILTRHPNGVIVAGPRDGIHIAITVDTVKHTTALNPLVGQFEELITIGCGCGHGWIFPAKEQPFVLEDWLRELREIPRLNWLKRLKAHVEHRPSVKIAIEGYSITDITTLGAHGWFVGRSAHAPLWRIYALIPEDLWEHGELPRIEGTMRNLNRFGAIYDPRRHTVKWKLNI